jgi:hypothetical protein
MRRRCVSPAASRAAPGSPSESRRR